MKHDRMAVLGAMVEQGVVPVFYHSDIEVCLKVIQACANGGAKCVEFTNRGDFAAQTFPRGRPAISPRPIPASSWASVRSSMPPLRVFSSPTAPNSWSAPSSTPMSPGSATAARSPTIPAAAQLPRYRPPKNMGCEIVKVFPGGSGRRPGFREECAGPGCRGARSCLPACADTLQRGIAEEMVSAPALSPAASAAT